MIPYPIDPAELSSVGTANDVTLAGSNNGTDLSTTEEATSEFQVPFLPDSPDPNDDKETPALKRAWLPSPNTQRVLANADSAYMEASRAIADFNKRSIDEITKAGEGEEQMNLRRLFPDDDDDYDDL